MTSDSNMAFPPGGGGGNIPPGKTDQGAFDEAGPLEAEAEGLSVV